MAGPKRNFPGLFALTKKYLDRVVVAKDFLGIEVGGRVVSCFIHPMSGRKMVRVKMSGTDSHVSIPVTVVRFVKNDRTNRTGKAASCDHRL